MAHQPPHILVVDDNDLNLEMMQAVLESDSYHVLTAHNGERALAIVEKSPPDVVMLDVRMPGISGYDVCRTLKGDPATQHIPILMVTGFRENHDIEEIIAAGADDMLFKPVHNGVMLLRVRRMAYQKQLYDERYG
jgi:two-component system cell cycle response regulator